MRLNPAAMVRRWPVASFFALAYLLSWSWWLPIAAAGDVVRPGDPWPTQMPGLLGPLLAACVVTGCVGGRRDLARFVRHLVRWRGGWRTIVFAASPLAMLAAGVLVVGVSGTARPEWQDLFVISGLPAAALPMLAGLLLVNGFGEEGGWRGFAQERLQRQHGPVRAALFTALVWAGWHAPLFVILASFRGFSAALLPGFFLGMVAGGMVLAHVYNAAGGSIAAAACWHVAYNSPPRRPRPRAPVAIVATTTVMIQAAAVLTAAYRRSRQHLPSPLVGGVMSSPRVGPPRPGRGRSVPAWHRPGRSRWVIEVPEQPAHSPLPSRGSPSACHRAGQRLACVLSCDFRPCRPNPVAGNNGYTSVSPTSTNEVSTPPGRKRPR